MKDAKQCSMCTKNKSIKSAFYSSYSPLFGSDKKVPICKDCLKTMVNVDNLESIHETLRICDKPFLAELWSKAIKLQKNTFGEYMRMVCSLHQYKLLTYKNSDSNEKIEKVLLGKMQEEKGVVTRAISDNSYDIDNDLVSKWGNQFSDREIHELEKLYKEMMFANAIETPQHQRQLFFYCKLNVLMDKALMEGDYVGYEKLSRQFAELQKSSGFRPIDRKSSDEANGIKSFSQIFAEVEANGYVEPLNIDAIENQDIVDKTILYIVNYTRRVLGMEKLVNPPTDTPKIESVDINGN